MPPPPSPRQDGLNEIRLDVEKLIGRLVIEHEMTRLAATAERQKNLARIKDLEALLEAAQNGIDK